MESFEGQTCFFCKNYWREDDDPSAISQCNCCDDYGLREPIDGYYEDVYSHRNELVYIPDESGDVEDDWVVWVFGLDAMRSDFIRKRDGEGWNVIPVDELVAKKVMKEYGLSDWQYMQIAMTIICKMPRKGCSLCSDCFGKK